jgi:hypothetical protein
VGDGGPRIIAGLFQSTWNEFKHPDGGVNVVSSGADIAGGEPGESNMGVFRGGLSIMRHGVMTIT